MSFISKIFQSKSGLQYIATSSNGICVFRKTKPNGTVVTTASKNGVLLKEIECVPMFANSKYIKLPKNIKAHTTTVKDFKTGVTTHIDMYKNLKPSKDDIIEEYTVYRTKFINEKEVLIGEKYSSKTMADYSFTSVEKYNGLENKPYSHIVTTKRGNSVETVDYSPKSEGKISDNRVDKDYDKIKTDFKETKKETTSSTKTKIVNEFINDSDKSMNFTDKLAIAGYLTIDGAYTNYAAA